MGARRHHLGSTAYTVNGTTETGEVRYRAFGATRFTSGVTPTSYRYTGQREEAGLGLYAYGARWYDPALGHFLQPDTIIPQPGNVLDYHRYSYTRFNPLKYTDPSGHLSILTQRAFSADMSIGAGLGLSGGNRVALTVAGAAGTATTLSTSLATGSPPSQPDPLPPLLETAPGQVAGASSTSFPLADGGPQTSIPPSTGVYNNTLSVLTEPRPGVDPTGHIYTANIVNKKGVPYPVVNDLRTNKPIPHSVGNLQKVPPANRVSWGTKERGEYIAEWNRRGLPEPPGGWAKHDVHHILLREYGGTNDFENLTPVERATDHQRFNRYWADYE